MMLIRKIVFCVLAIATFSLTSLSLADLPVPIKPIQDPFYENIEGVIVFVRPYYNFDLIAKEHLFSKSTEIGTDRIETLVTQSMKAVFDETPELRMPIRAAEKGEVENGRVSQNILVVRIDVRYQEIIIEDKVFFIVGMTISTERQVSSGSSLPYSKKYPSLGMDLSPYVFLFEERPSQDSILYFEGALSQKITSVARNTKGQILGLTENVKQ